MCIYIAGYPDNLIDSIEQSLVVIAVSQSVCHFDPD